MELKLHGSQVIEVVVTNVQKEGDLVEIKVKGGKIDRIKLEEQNKAKSTCSQGGVINHVAFLFGSPGMGDS